MADLVEGRYPVAEEEWILDGTPFPPFRRTINRRDITGGYAVPSTKINCYAVPVQQGDIFNYVSFLVSTAGGTLTNSWIAVYSGVATGAALLGQTTSVTTGTGWTANTLEHLVLTAAASDVAQPGTPQGPSGGPGSWSIVTAGPAVWGVVVYQAGTTGNTLDGMAGGAVAGGAVTSGNWTGPAAPAYGGQVPMYSTGTLANTATAPAVLPTMTAAVPNGNGGVPYIVLSRY